MNLHQLRHGSALFEEREKWVRFNKGMVGVPVIGFGFVRKEGARVKGRKEDYGDGIWEERERSQVGNNVLDHQKGVVSEI